jgi:hypothetical protein
MKKSVNLTWIITTLLVVAFNATEAQSVKRAKNVIVASESGKFCGWPANNGDWTWDNGREILVGYSFQDFVEQPGHNIKGLTGTAPDIITRLARSTDGGLTWASEDPENFVGDGQSSVPSPGGINFQAPVLPCGWLDRVITVLTIPMGIFSFRTTVAKTGRVLTSSTG